MATSFSISKYKLRKELIEHNLNAAFRAFCQANPEFFELYNDALELQSDNPDFIMAFQAFCTLSNVTEEIGMALLEAARAGEIPVEIIPDAPVVEDSPPVLDPPQ